MFQYRSNKSDGGATAFKHTCGGHVSSEASGSDATPSFRIVTMTCGHDHRHSEGRTVCKSNEDGTETRKHFLQ